MAIENALARISRTVDDSVFQRGQPYSGHGNNSQNHESAVIYIPSQEDFNADIARLDSSPTGYRAGSASFKARKTSQTGLHSTCDLLDDFLYSVHTTSHAVVPLSRSNMKTKGSNTKQLKTEINERDMFEFTAGKSESDMKTLNLCLPVDVTGTDKPINQESITDERVGNNFVEINIVALDSPVDNDESMNVLNDNGMDNNKSSDKPLGSIVKQLIKKIFDNPHKTFTYQSSNRNNDDKHREIKISVDELFADKHHLGFIVDNKQQGSLTKFFSSKKFMFMQLCFLAIMSVYFMSFYNTSYHVRN